MGKLKSMEALGAAKGYLKK